MSLESRYRLETPENIELDYEVAGVGSRFCALAVDGLIQTFVLLAIIFVLALLNVNILPVDADIDPAARNFGLETWAQAVILVIALVIFFGGYPMFFELLMRGQTPGKRILKIRAIAENGTPMTASQTLTRNLVRLVDMLPGFYFVGGMVMFFHPLHRRLGDLASGTLVVKEREVDYRARADERGSTQMRSVEIANTELTPDESRLLLAFLYRRTEFEPEIRVELARKLANAMYDKYGGTIVHPERYLQRLIQGMHYEPASSNSRTQTGMGSLPQDDRPRF